MKVKIGGSGTEQDPYRISSLEQLQAIRREPRAYYRLMNDIDARNDERQEFKPIKDIQNPFTGTFYGNNYEIRNLCIKQLEEGNVGLFGYIGKEGHIKNIGLTNATISGQVSVGSLAGRSYGKIESSYVKGGDVSGEKYVGGLVGKNFGDIESSCVQESDVSGLKSVGGLGGKSFRDIESSYAQGGNVSGDRNVGGLVGVNYCGELELSYVVKEDVSGDKNVGGLVGRNYRGKVESSYALRGDVLEGTDNGGLVGLNDKGQLEGCSDPSKSDYFDGSEDADLVISRENHRVLYVLATNMLHIQVDGEIYSCAEESPTKVQSLVHKGKSEMNDKFRASFVKSI